MNYTEEQIKEIVRRVISEMPNVSLENLSGEQKTELAQNPNTSPETLDFLGGVGNESVRWRVAQNPNTSPKTLARLANDKFSGVRQGVAQNPNTSPQILGLLATDKNGDVRRNVARNLNTPPETLDRLANDEYYWIRRIVAINHNTVPETLERLAIDKNGDVRSSATNNPKYNKKITVTLTLTQKQLTELQKSGSYSFKLS